MQIALGNIVQESNSFSPIPGSWAHFPPGHLLRGDEILAQRAGTRTEIGGAIDVAREDGATLLPLLSATTSASAGHMLREVFEALRDELVAGLRAAQPFEGVLLVLHGAMAAEGYEDATGEILRAARAAVGPGMPLVATLDLHANVTNLMVEQAGALVGYHTSPHIDLYEIGQPFVDGQSCIAEGEGGSIGRQAGVGPVRLGPRHSAATEANDARMA